MEFAKNMSKDDKAIVFCGKKARADDLSSEMSLKGFEVQCIHGDRDQVSLKVFIEIQLYVYSSL